MSTPKMRAKVKVASVMPMLDQYGRITQEKLSLYGVAKNDGYPADGSDEDNTFAKFSPQVEFSLMIANPALLGAFSIGDTFYVNFTPVPENISAAADASVVASVAEPAASAA